MANQKEKGKKSDKKRFMTGCLRLMGVVLALPLLCYTSLWLFAHFGGEWATSYDIPIPPDSDLIFVSYNDDYLEQFKTSVYVHSLSPEALRVWFQNQHISMSPVSLNMENTSFIDYDDYYGTLPLFSMTSSFHRFHDFAALITHGSWNEMSRSCQSVRVFKTTALGRAEFPELEIPDDGSVFAVTNCWFAQ